MQRRVQQRRGRGCRRIGGCHGGSGANCTPVPPKPPGIICPCCPLYLRDWRRRERHRLPLRWTRSKRVSLQRGTPAFASACQSLVPERSTRPEGPICAFGGSATEHSPGDGQVVAAARQRGSDNPCHDEHGRMADGSSRSISRRRAWRTTPKARWCSSRMRWPARRCRSRSAGARTTGSRRRWSRCAGRARSGSCRAARTSASAAAARCSTCTSPRRWRPSSARWKTRSGTSARSGPSRCCGRSKGRPGATGSGPGSRCVTSSKKGTVLVGFHERKSSYVADIRSCDVLPRHVSDMLLPLRELVGAMRPRDRLPQIELAVGDDDHGAGAAPPRAAARGGSGAAARASRRRTASSGGSSPRGRTPRTRSTARRPPSPTRLPEFGIRMPFRPTDFTQVNRDINRVLVSRARAPARARSPAIG